LRGAFVVGLGDELRLVEELVPPTL
jgi:hypothetical protein